MPLTEKTKHVLIWLVPIVLVLFLVPASFYTTPATGPDPSLAIAVHLALKDHLLFGKDVIFSFGPLSVLLFRYPVFIGKYVFLVSDLFFFYTLFVVFRAVIRRNFQWGTIIFLFACVLVCQYMDIDKWYFLLTLFFLFLFLETPAGIPNVLYAGILSLICLYINASPLGLLAFAATVIYAMVSGKVGWLRGAVILDAFLVALWISTRLLHTDLPGYIEGSFQLGKDHADVMYLPLAGRFGQIAGWGAAIVFLLFLACYTLVGIKWFRDRRAFSHSDTVFIYILVAAGLFFSYKSGFVRADMHVFIFFQVVAPLALLLYLFTPAGRLKKIIRVCCWTILAANIAVIELLPDPWRPDSFRNLVTGALIPVKIGEVKNYFRQLGEYDDQLLRYRYTTTLPNEYRHAIGGHTADIVPSEVSTVFFNGLNYDPRPSVQSYLAYNPYLDSLNASKYLSANAPEYVLFSLDAMEERFLWTDEGRVKLALLQRYRFVQTIGGQLLLRRRDTPRPLIRMNEETVKVQLGAEIPVRKPPGNQFQFSKLIIHYNWSGKLRGLIYQPPPLQIVYRIDDGDVQYHKALLPVCADGMILNKFVDDTREFQLFLLSDGQLNADVRSFRIEPVSPGGFSPDITLINTWYNVGDKTAAEQREDSLDIVRLVNGNERISPLPQPPSDAAGPTIRYGISSYRDHGGLVRLQGWATRGQDNDSDYSVSTLARSANGSVYPFFSEKFSVPAYPADLQDRKHLDNAGVLSIVSKSQLPVGNYQLGLALCNRKTHTSLVSYIDKYFHVDKEYSLQRIARMSAGSPDKDSLQFNIDSIGNSDEGLVIQGWAALTNAKTAPTTALLLQNDTATYRVVANRRRRPDIMAVYKRSFLEYSGFLVRLAGSDLPKGTFSVGLGVLSPDGRTRSWKFTDRKIRLGMTRNSIPVRVTRLPPPEDFTGNIDLATVNGNVIRAEGWAIGDTAFDKGDLIEVILKGDIYTFVAPVDKTFRADVAARLNKRIANCGVDAKIAMDPLPFGKYRLGLLIHPPGKPGFVRFFDKTIEKK